jgi:hypothetical protein
LTKELEDGRAFQSFKQSKEKDSWTKSRRRLLGIETSEWAPQGPWWKFSEYDRSENIYWAIICPESAWTPWRKFFVVVNGEGLCEMVFAAAPTFQQKRGIREHTAKAEETTKVGNAVHDSIPS